MTEQTTIENNNAIIATIKGNNSLKKRIANECAILYSLYPSVEISLDAGALLNVSVYETVNNYRRIYRFVLKENYPFEPPKIYYNNYLYFNLLYMSGEYEKKMVKRLRGRDCLCCYSVNCRVNWSPSIRLYRIIDEIKDILQLKRTITNILLAEKIKAKYNIPYAYIEDYLGSAG